MITCWARRHQFTFSSLKHTLAIVRHGQSIWNKQKKWAGWTDIPLSSFGIKEMKQCAKALKAKGIIFDKVYTSVLSRAIKATNIVLDELDLHSLPVHKDWRLNEKHYGQLQGCSKVELTEKHGEKVVTQWRRSMTVPPPPLDKNDPTHPLNNPMYKYVDRNLLPSSQSLSDVIGRLKPLWQNQISKDIKTGKNVLVVAHGSSLRALIHILNPQMSEDQLKNFNIPNAIPMLFSLDENLHAQKMEYVGDQHEIDVKMNKIKYETQRKQIE